MSANNELVLRVITFIGCTVSIICLTFTFITLVSFRFDFFLTFITKFGLNNINNYQLSKLIGA